MAQKSNITKDKSFAFAVRIVNLEKYLRQTKRETVLSRQILRSGHRLVLTFGRAAMRNRVLILSTKWALLKRNATKHVIGWSC